MNQRFRVDLRARISLGADRFSTFRRSEPAGSLDRVINRKGPFKRRENGGTKRTKKQADRTVSTSPASTTARDTTVRQSLLQLGNTRAGDLGVAESEIRQTGQPREMHQSGVNDILFIREVDVHYLALAIPIELSPQFFQYGNRFRCGG